MSAKHRAERGRNAPRSASAPAVPTDDDEIFGRPPRRWLRRLAWVAAALISAAVVLGGVVAIGCRTGANACPGRDVYSGSTGMEIFQRNCANCHGAQGQGRTGPAFTPGGTLSGLTFDQRVEKIGRGKPLNAMPRWRGKLTPEQIRMVAAYTQLLSGQQPEPTVGGVR